MGTESAFLRDLPGLIFLGLGLASQYYLCRRFSVNRALNVGFSLLEIVLFCLTNEPLSPSFRRVLPFGLEPGVLGACLMLWLWMITPAAAISWLFGIVRKKIEADNFRADRRAVLNAVAGVLSAAPAAVLTFGIIKRKEFVVNEIDLKFPNLAKDLQGLRLLQLSDMHMGEFFSASDVARVVAASNTLRADIAFVTGDFITTKYDPLDQCLAELSRLRAAAGIWGCLGNHEQHQRIENYTTRKALEFNIQVLRREARLLTFGGSKLNLAGVDHQRRNRPYLTKAEELVAPGVFNLLLSHNPDVFPTAAHKGFDLTLAGHTHGGQLNLSISGGNLNIADLITPFTKGFYRLANASLYVNSGLGTIGVPVRLGAPPEITLIRLCNS